MVLPHLLFLLEGRLSHGRGRLDPEEVELVIYLLDKPHVVVAVVPLNDCLVQRQLLSHLVVCRRFVSID